MWCKNCIDKLYSFILLLLELELEVELKLTHQKLKIDRFKITGVE